MLSKPEVKIQSVTVRNDLARRTPKGLRQKLWRIYREPMQIALTPVYNMVDDDLYEESLKDE